MPALWPTVRTHEDSKGTNARRSKRSAAVGPPAANHGNNDDLESQAATSRRISGSAADTAIPEVKARAVLDAGPGMDGVETQMSVLTFLKIVTALSALYMSVNPWLFFYKADKGEICPSTVLCATRPVELVLLTGSRLSAGALLSSLTISIVSKCYATRSFLHHSWLGAVLDFEPSHTVHTYFGFLTLVAGLEHAVLHCARFIYAQQAYLICHTATGRSGVIGCIFLLPVVLPMKFEFLRTKMSFEVRKALHFLFVPLTVAICFHSVTLRYIGSVLIVWCLLDRMYFTTKQTFLIADPFFQAIGRGTRVILDLPVGYSFKAGSYIYVNSPMISRSEWHPFSIIQVPGKRSRATFYAENVGDWTEALFNLGVEQPGLPLWITAAQPSLMEKSIYYDNVVLVCTGAGITPAVSIIERFAKRKSIHLLWMTRDGSIVALFEKQLRQVNSTVHITGQPTEETKVALQRLLRPSKKAARYTQIEQPHQCYCHLYGAGAKDNMSVRSIPTNDSFASTPSGAMMADIISDTCGDEVKIDCRGTDESDFLPTKQFVLPDAVGLATHSSSKQRFRANTTKENQTDPVTLVFGRPDIGAYLRDAFAIQTEAPGTGHDPLADEPALGTAVVDLEKLHDVEGSGRLDSEQKTCKETLMKADASVVEAALQKRRRNLDLKTQGGSNLTVETEPSSNCPLVLYCGANAKVEEAVGKTCDELRVPWQKEYFAAW